MTIYLPEPLKRDLERAARAEGLSDAQLIRTAIETFLAARSRRRPTPPLFSSGSRRSPSAWMNNWLTLANDGTRAI
jgi:hypothetical protein